MFPASGPLDGGVGVEDGLAHGGPRRGVHAPAQRVDVVSGRGLLVEAGEHQLGELVAGDALDRLVEGDHALFDELVGDAEGRRRRALAHAGLEHPQLAALDGELDVAEVAVVVLQRVHDAHELFVAVGVDAFQVGEGDGVAHTRHDVLALGVLEVVAVDAGAPGGRVAGEGDPGAGVHAEVAEDHGADVDGGAEVGGDAFLAPVERGAGGVPGLEDRPDGAGHLFAGVGREGAAGPVGDDLLEAIDETAEVVGVEVEVVGDALGLLGLLDRLFEEVAVDVLDRLAEHLDEAAVGVPGEALVAAPFGQAEDGLVVEADVEDGLHHARHGEPGPRTHAHQEWVVGAAQSAPHLLLQTHEVGLDLFVQAVGHAAVVEVVPARLGGDGEAGGNREAEVGHLGEVGALATEKILHVLVALGERVDVLGHGGTPSLSR